MTVLSTVGIMRSYVAYADKGNSIPSHLAHFLMSEKMKVKLQFASSNCMNVALELLLIWPQR